MEVIPSSNPDSPLPDSFDSFANLEDEIESFGQNSLNQNEDIFADDLCLKDVEEEGIYFCCIFSYFAAQ